MQKIILILALFMGITAQAGEIDPEVSPDFKVKLKPNRRAKYPAGFNAYGFGPIGTAAISFDYFITPKWAIEVGAGTKNLDPELAFTVGGRYHFFGNTPFNITPYVGVYSGFAHNGKDLQNYNLYIPVGIHRIKRNKISWSIEVAYRKLADRPDDNFYGGARLGFRF